MTKLSMMFALVAAACGSVQSSPLPDGGTPPPPSDGAPPTGRCDPGKPFAAPTRVAAVNTADNEIGFALTRDERTGFITRMVTDGSSLTASLVVARRSGLAEPFGAAADDATRPLNDVYGEELLSFPTRDGLTLYFSRQVESNLPRLITTTRTSPSATFSLEVEVLVSSQPITGSSPVLSGDDRRLYWVDVDNTLHSATRQDSANAFADQLDLSTDEVTNPVLSADELTLYYSINGDADVVVATRPTTTAAFGAATLVAGVNTDDNDAPVYLTADGCVLYLKSTRPGGLGGMDLWQAERPR